MVPYGHLQKRKVNRDERKVDAFYGGKIWFRSVLPVSPRSGAYFTGGVHAAEWECSGKCILSAGSARAYLLLLPYVFQKCIKKIRRERELPCEDKWNPPFLPEAEEPDAAEKGIPHLQVSGLQAEDPDSEGKRKD